MTTIESKTTTSDLFDAQNLARVKVPQKITYFFWIVKSCATTVGESLSDFFNVDLGLGLGGAAALFFPLLLINLIVQFYYPRYTPAVYWMAVILLSICGTIMTDGLHDNLGVELWIENVVFFFLVVVCFGTWYKVEGTLDIHSINTPRREMFYWLTILFTFALGTAIGDGIAEAAGFGYGATFGLFCGALIVIFFLWYFKVTGEITSFWLAYIMTRPLGASAGDLLASPKSTHSGGLGVGCVSGIFTALILICVAILMHTKMDQVDATIIDTEDDKANATKVVEIEVVPASEPVAEV